MLTLNMNKNETHSKIRDTELLPLQWPQVDLYISVL